MSAEHLEHIRRCEWLSAEDSPFPVAACVTVVVGGTEDPVASAFGIDLGSPRAADRGEFGEQTAGVQTVAAADGTAVVVVSEDNGFEGSRAKVLAAASRGGRAASVLWNVDAMVIFSCARNGRILYSDEVALADETDGLPKALRPYAELAQDEDLDLDWAASSAAMVEAYTGVRLDLAAVTPDTVYPVTPHVDRPPKETLDDALLGSRHAKLVGLIGDLSADRRRALVQLLAGLAVARADVADAPGVADVLASLTPSSVGTMNPRLESARRTWEKESNRYDDQWEDAQNSGDDPPSEEERQRAKARRWAGLVLAYACDPDDVSAALGAVYWAAPIFRADRLQRDYFGVVRQLVRAAPADWPGIVATLPPAPTSDDRARALEAEAAARAQREADEEEAWIWAGYKPTQRMKDAAGPDRSLRAGDRATLERLAQLPDDVLVRVTGWAALRTLEAVGLLDRPWLAPEVAQLRRLADGEVPEVDRRFPEQRMRELWAELERDPDRSGPTYVDEDGDRISMRHAALPVVTALRADHPLATACSVVEDAHWTFGPGFQALTAEMWARFDPPS